MINDSTRNNPDDDGEEFSMEDLLNAMNAAGVSTGGALESLQSAFKEPESREDALDMIQKSVDAFREASQEQINNKTERVNSMMRLYAALGAAYVNCSSFSGDEPTSDSASLELSRGDIEVAMDILVEAMHEIAPTD